MYVADLIFMRLWAYLRLHVQFLVFSNEWEQLMSTSEPESTMKSSKFAKYYYSGADICDIFKNKEKSCAAEILSTKFTFFQSYTNKWYDSALKRLRR